MNKKQAFDTLAKYRFKHRAEQEANARDMAQALRRVAVSDGLTQEEITEALKGVVILPALILDLIKFAIAYKAPLLKDHESV